MKKVTISITIALLVIAMAYTALAWGPSHGGRGNYPVYQGPYGTTAPQSGLTEEQRTQLDQLQKKFFDETAQLRNELGSKSMEMNNLLRTSNPDEAKVKALQKEVSDLRAKLSEKRVDLDLEARKIVPEGYYYGQGYGRGHAPAMGYGSKHRW